ncbi:RING-type domain-containing protein [Entamoeba marina]
MNNTNRPTLPASTILESFKTNKPNIIYEKLLSQNTITQEYLTILIHSLSKDPSRLQAYLERLDFESNQLDIEKVIFELIEAGMSENAKKFAEKRSPSSYIKILLRNAISTQSGNAHDAFQQALEYIEHQPFGNKVTLLQTYGKPLVDALQHQPTSTSHVLLKQLTTQLIALFLEKPTNYPRLDPGDFLHVFENAPTELDEFLNRIQSKFTDLPSQNDKVSELLIEMHLKEDTERSRAKAIMLYKSNTKKHEHIKNLFFNKKILHEVVADPDERLLCLLQEQQTNQIDDRMRVGVHYLPLLCDAAETSGVEKVLRGIFQEPSGEKTPPHKIINVLEVLARPEILKNLSLDPSIKESLKAGLGFIDEIPTLRESIEDYQTRLGAKLVFKQTKCSKCGAEFKETESDYPIIHFHCGHSYHKKCFDGAALECSQCARQKGFHNDIVGEEEFQRAVNTTQFQGFYELIKSVATILDADDVKNGEVLQEQDDAQDDVFEQNQSDDDEERLGQFIDRNENYNPFLDADTSANVLGYDRSSAYSGTQFAGKEDQKEQFYSVLF